MKGATLRGRSFLQSDLARVGRLNKPDLLKTLGLEVQSTTRPLDAVSREVIVWQCVYNVSDFEEYL